jgi:hypothetical protein
LRIFKNKWFIKFSRKERIGDAKLCDLVTAAEKGLVDADLGSGVIKQRLARDGEGGSGGYRTIIFYRKAGRAFFVFAFAKSERENLDPDELAAFKKIAKSTLDLSDEQIGKLKKSGNLQEVKCNEQTKIQK